MQTAWLQTAWLQTAWLQTAWMNTNRLFADIPQLYFRPLPVNIYRTEPSTVRQGSLPFRPPTIRYLVTSHTCTSLEITGVFARSLRENLSYTALTHSKSVLRAAKAHWNRRTQRFMVTSWSGCDQKRKQRYFWLHMPKSHKTYIRTYIRTYINTYIRTYILT